MIYLTAVDNLGINSIGGGKDTTIDFYNCTEDLEGHAFTTAYCMLFAQRCMFLNGTIRYLNGTVKFFFGGGGGYSTVRFVNCV